MACIWNVARTGTGGRAVVDVLTEALAADPWLSWALPDVRAVRSLHSLFLRTVAGPAGQVLVATPPGGGPPVGVAVMVPPSAEVPEDAEVGEMVLRLHGRHAGRALDADAIVDRLRPIEPLWTLHALGVRPPQQRRGVGSALIAECLEVARGGPMVVETSSAAARSFYEVQGFQVRHEVDLSDGHGLGPDAPTVWLMQRG